MLDYPLLGLVMTQGQIIVWEHSKVVSCRSHCTPVKMQAMDGLLRLKVTRCVWLLQLCLLLLCLLGQLAWGFSDLGESRHPDALIYLRARGIIAGYPDGTFRPQLTISRAELLALLLRGEASDARDCFTDVTPSAWYAGVVCSARMRGLITGYSDNTFRPQQPVTYAEALKLVLDSYEVAVQPQEGPWYLAYERVALERGFVASDSYAPNTPVTRDGLAQLLYRVVLSQQVTPPSRAGATPVEGCGVAPGVAPSSLVVAGLERRMIVAVPNGYDPQRLYPLVVAFHGRTNSNVQVRSYFELESELDAIIVYPSGLTQGGVYTWSDGGDSSDALRDYALFDEIVRLMQRRYCIDSSKIFVVGHSLGAWFANSLACVRGDVIRAVATVAGGISPSDCQGRVAAMLLHNPADNLVSIGEGEMARDTFLAQLETPGQPLETGEPVLQALSCMRYHAARYPLVWCPHTISRTRSGRNYPHLWPTTTAAAMAHFFNSLP